VAQLSYEVRDSSGNRLSGYVAQFGSYTPAVASVGSDGLLTALKPGVAVAWVIVAGRLVTHGIQISE
jgi:hypothetical protein